MRAIVLFAALAAALSACVTTNYKPYEGAAVQMGTGGARTSIAGVDLWEDGTPPRKYLVVGIIDDKRRNEALDRSSFHGDIAKKVKENGGDAAIILGRSELFRGTVNTGNTYGTVTKANAKSANVQAYSTGVGIPLYDVNSKIQVIKYVAE